MNNWWFVIIGAVVVAVVLVIVAYKSYDNCYEVVWPICAVFAAVLSMFVVVMCIVVPVVETENKADCERYKIKYEYVMDVIDEMDVYQYANMGITQTILEYNEWLDEAKARKAIYGNWSFYRTCDVENMERIGIRK